MAIEINLATYDKQNEILSSLDGGETLMYKLAKSDSTASQSDIQALKEMPHIKNIVNSSTAMEAVANSSMAMEVVLNSSMAMEAVANSSTAMTAVANSSTAMEAVANSSMAMEAVLNSSMAMEAVLNSSMAMEAVLNSSTAMDMVKTNSIAIGKIVAKLAGLNTSDYANIEAVLNSSIAMTAVANSSIAMTVVANSSIAIKMIANSSVSLEILLESKNCKELSSVATISGQFLPLKSNSNSAHYQAFNGKWSNIGDEVGRWIKDNLGKPIASSIKSEGYNGIYYYDLNA